MTNPRCSSHKDRTMLPAACPTCNRIKIEQAIVRATVHALIAAGYRLQTDMAGEGMEPPTPTNKESAILEHLMEVDDEHLMVYGPENRIGWVRFVYGNDGWDVISDYTTNLEGVMAPVLKKAEELS